MPKRKREESLAQKLAGYEEELYKAFMGTKGFERQRLSKRLRDTRTTQEKTLRLQKEVETLKTLDLHQTAHAHLTFCLRRIPGFDDSDALPDTFQKVTHNADLGAEEKAVLHNVTSGLCNYDQVRKVLDRAVAGVCDSLRLPIPGKKARGKKSAGTQREPAGEAEAQPIEEENPRRQDLETHGDESVGDDAASDAEPGEEPVDVSSEEEAEVEEALSKYDRFLGNSSDEEDPDEVEDILLRGKRDPQDDMSLSGSASKEPSPEPLEGARSPSPPPAKKEKKDKAEKAKVPKPAKAGDSTFLPTLMGGYISGSESASDIDLAPSKKRLGQRQRQAKWERKFGTKAKHLEHAGAGRDAGWDMKRGAVEGDARGRRPGKAGKSQVAPSASRNSERGEKSEQGAGRRQMGPTAPTKPADDRPMHPSWEAARKAKASAKPAAFQGKRVVFD